jgi:two-component system sensor histidine kinase UhpB
LRWYSARFARETGLRVVPPDDLTPRLPLTVEAALFRIAQEALTNVGRHAGANTAWLTLAYVGELARFVIADDGKGFSSQEPRRIVERPRWGLITMRERAETVGAIMRVDSTPNQGTRITIEVAR